MTTMYIMLREHVTGRPDPSGSNREWGEGSFSEEVICKLRPAMWVEEKS